jgi:hypothetical protein
MLASAQLNGIGAEKVAVLVSFPPGRIANPTTAVALCMPSVPSGWLSGRIGQFGQFPTGEEAVWIACACARPSGGLRAALIPPSARKDVLT